VLTVRINAAGTPASVVPVALTGTGPCRASTSNSTVFVGTGGNVAAGTYGWVITYSGDANYNTATFSCVRQFTAN
jgi:hypothetical protein